MSAKVRISKTVSMVLVAIGLIASLASASPKSIEDTTLSLRDFIADLHAVEEAKAINHGGFDGMENGELIVAVPNEVMLGPVVNIERATASSTASVESSPLTGTPESR